jgi:hypothetical protein
VSWKKDKAYQKIYFLLQNSKYSKGSEYYEYCRKNKLMPTEEGYKIWYEKLDILNEIEKKDIRNHPKYCMFESKICQNASNKDGVFECTAKTDNDMKCR